MKRFYPNYYPKFACLMGACRHSCCIGWEIDIDAETRERYASVPGAMGRRLKEHIADSEEGSSFRLTAQERCPFLNAEGLCDLIIELGEENLCQICADHPRFRNFFSDRIETGLGLCCEAAARTILTAEEPFSLMCSGDDRTEMDELLAEEDDVLLLREELLDIMQNRALPVTRRVELLQEAAQLSDFTGSMAAWAGFFLQLERLDDAWAEYLQILEREETISEPEMLSSAVWEIAFEQLMAYLLFRHVAGAVEDSDLSGRIAFVVLIWRLLRAICCVLVKVRGGLEIEDLLELARMYSSEIEYSDENIERILNELHRIDPEL